MLAIVQPSLSHPLRQGGHGRWIVRHMIEDHEALHPRAFYKDVPLDPRAGRPGRPIADCSGAADHDPCADREVAHDGIAARASGVGVIDVDSVRTAVTEGTGEVVGMIDASRVINEIFDDTDDRGSHPRSMSKD